MMKKTGSKEKKKQDRYKKFAKALADPRITNDNKKTKNVPKSNRKETVSFHNVGAKKTNNIERDVNEFQMIGGRSPRGTPHLYFSYANGIQFEFIRDKMHYTDFGMSTPEAHSLPFQECLPNPTRKYNNIEWIRYKFVETCNVFYPLGFKHSVPEACCNTAEIDTIFAPYIHLSEKLLCCMMLHDEIEHFDYQHQYIVCILACNICAASKYYKCFAEDGVIVAPAGFSLYGLIFEFARNLIFHLKTGKPLFQMEWLFDVFVVKNNPDDKTIKYTWNPLYTHNNEWKPRKECYCGQDFLHIACQPMSATTTRHKTEDTKDSVLHPQQDIPNLHKQFMFSNPHEILEQRWLSMLGSEIENTYHVQRVITGNHQDINKVDVTYIHASTLTLIKDIGNMLQFHLPENITTMKDAQLLPDDYDMPAVCFIQTCNDYKPDGFIQTNISDIADKFGLIQNIIPPYLYLSEKILYAIMEIQQISNLPISEDCICFMARHVYASYMYHIVQMTHGILKNCNALHAYDFYKSVLSFAESLIDKKINNLILQDMYLIDAQVQTSQESEDLLAVRVHRCPVYESGIYNTVQNVDVN